MEKSQPQVKETRGTRFGLASEFRAKWYITALYLPTGEKVILGGYMKKTKAEAMLLCFSELELCRDIQLEEASEVREGQQGTTIATCRGCLRQGIHVYRKDLCYRCYFDRDVRRRFPGLHCNQWDEDR